MLRVYPRAGGGHDGIVDKSPPPKTAQYIRQLLNKHEAVKSRG